MNLPDVRNNEIPKEIHRSQLPGGSQAGIIATNIFAFNDKFMFPVRQIKSCQILAKNKFITTKTIPYPRRHFLLKRLNPGGAPKGRILGRESILTFGGYNGGCDWVTNVFVGQV